MRRARHAIRFSWGASHDVRVARCASGYTYRIVKRPETRRYEFQVYRTQHTANVAHTLNQDPLSIVVCHTVTEAKAHARAWETLLDAGVDVIDCPRMSAKIVYETLLG